VLHRDADGEYTVLDGGETALDADRDYALPRPDEPGWRITSPSGLEQFLLIAASSPVTPDEMRQSPRLLEPKLIVRAAHFEVRP
jgi:hypothetical protein